MWLMLIITTSLIATKPSESQTKITARVEDVVVVKHYPNQAACMHQIDKVQTDNMSDDPTIAKHVWCVSAN